MNAAGLAFCRGADPGRWIPPGFHPYPGSPPPDATRCVVLLKHRGGDWVGPRLAYFVDGGFQDYRPESASRGGWCIYAWRPAHASDVLRIPRLVAVDSAEFVSRVM